MSLQACALIVRIKYECACLCRLSLQRCGGKPVSARRALTPRRGGDQTYRYGKALFHPLYKRPPAEQRAVEREVVKLRILE